MSDRPFYDVLGVSREATGAEIKRAFRARSRECHPDACPGDPEAAERFHALTEAYEALSDPEARAIYDETGAAPASERSLEAAAHNMLALFFEKVLVSNRRLELDAVNAVRRLLTGTIAEGEKALVSTLKEAEDLTRILSRVTAKKRKDERGDGVAATLQAITQSKLDESAHNERENTRQMEVCKLALELLNTVEDAAGADLERRRDPFRAGGMTVQYWAWQSGKSRLLMDMMEAMKDAEKTP